MGATPEPAPEPTPGGTDRAVGDILVGEGSTTGRLLAAQWIEVDALLRQADLKAQVLLGIDALLLSALSRSESSGAGLAPVNTPLEYLMLVALFGSIALAMFTIVPRHGGPTKHSTDLLYFEALASMDPQEFADRYLDTGHRKLVRNVLLQIHIKSRIATAKLARVRQGILLLGAAAVLWGIALVVGT